MIKPRKRRSFRRAVTAVGVIVLLLSEYVGSYCALWWLIGRAAYDARLDQMRLSQIQAIVHAPILKYILTDLPGSATLEALGIWSNYQGQDTPESFGDCIDGVALLRKRRSE
jgi:hypothetical protein